MRAGAWTVLACLLASCGSATPPADVAPADFELATAGVLGDLPPAAGRVTVGIARDGALTIDGAPCRWSDLTARLDAATAPPAREDAADGGVPLHASLRAEVLEEELEEVEEDAEEVSEQEIVAEEPVIADGELRADEPAMAAVLGDPRPAPRPAEPVAPDGLRNADVLLRVDRRAPYALVVDVLEAAASPRTKLRRIFFAVQGADGAGVGAVGVFLPVDSCASKGYLPGAVVDLRLAEGQGYAAPGALADVLHGFRERPGELLAVRVRAPGDARFECVLEAMDAALQAGAVNVHFEGGRVRARERSAAEWCAAAAAAPNRAWRPRQPVRDLRPSAPPPGPGRVRGYAGVVNDMRVGDDLEPEVRDDPEPPR